MEEIEDNEEEERFEFEALWRKRRKNWSDDCERTRRWTIDTRKQLKMNWIELSV